MVLQKRAGSSAPYRGIGTNLNLATFLLFLFVLTFAQQERSTTDAARKVYRVKSTNSPPKQHNRTVRKCLVLRDPEMHLMADQICELCHEMFSHVQPNLRAECSSRCYKNAQFRKCLEMYTALPEGHPGGTPKALSIKRNDDKMEQAKDDVWIANMRTMANMADNRSGKFFFLSKNK